MEHISDVLDKIMRPFERDIHDEFAPVPPGYRAFDVERRERRERPDRIGNVPFYAFRNPIDTSSFLNRLNRAKIVTSTYPCPCGGVLTFRTTETSAHFGCVLYPTCTIICSVTSGGKPNGLPINSEGRKLRIKAHEIFDRLWKSGKYTRAEAYRLLTKKFKIAQTEAHFAKFTHKELRRSIEWMTSNEFQDL